MKCPKCHGTNVGMRAALLIWKDTEKRAKIIVRCLDGCGSWTFLDNVTPGATITGGRCRNCGWCECCG